MCALLQHLDIFELRPLVTNLSCKLSTVTEYDTRKQLLALVSDENEIVLRFTSEGGQEVLKLICWFRRTNRVIHDVCFDPTGAWLLVLCFDNTLHIVPALAVVDKSFTEPTNSAQNQHLSPQPQHPFSTLQITSYIIPFVGPHECPNSKKCPNHNATKTLIASKNEKNKSNDELKKEVIKLVENFERFKTAEENLKEQSQLEDEKDGVVVLPSEEKELLEGRPPTPEHEDAASIAAFSQDLPENMRASNTVFNQSIDKTGNSQVMATSFMASKTCPYPLSVVWWQTMDGTNRAIIGYSDGSICFVGLSPNCPFVASTAIDSGSVVKLLICKDNTFESVMLLITSSLKQQFKLLLEQKAIKYIYPGDNSPTTSQARENDWQIVMPLKTNSNCSDPASDSSQLEEDVFAKSDEYPINNTSNTNSTSLATTSNNLASTMPATATAPTVATVSRPTGPTPAYISTNEMPPPPPYSVAINRHLDSAPITTTAGVRFQQQQQQQLPPDFDELNGRAGILPTARARLASLKSLGSKKLNAIKMRLSDNRQKLEEYLPESNIGSFAIIDSPSLTPELLGNSAGSFYTIQNLRNTYLLSALHSQSNSLTVHSIDINLKPLFLYKIPKNCFDILISSNLLYSIQYVEASQTANENPIKAEQPDNSNKSLEEFLSELALNDDPLDKADVDAAATTSGPSTNSCVTPSNLVNAVGVISSAMASLRTGDEDKFNDAAMLTLVRFENETVLSVYQMATYRPNEQTEVITKEEKAKAFGYKGISTPIDYVQFYENANVHEDYSLRQMEIMQNEFPKINYDPCYVVTNKNVYYIQLKKEPFAIFLDAALAGEWSQCREFCNTFDLAYETCIEFAGDFLLRRKKVTQALLTYNNARIKPIRTALKLAMFGQTSALMQLCAMALKLTYVLKSTYFSHPIIRTILGDITHRHSEDVRDILPPTVGADPTVIVNEGAPCSDYNYGCDESASNLQMSPSSQFHLANLLLITLAEKAVNDKNYLPLWNFLVTNSKYHTNMTSIVLCQSGLFSAALILAKMRGVCIDTFLSLTSVVAQEFGWYTELNVCLYNLSEPIFAETITYLPHVACDYFNFIQEKLEPMRFPVLRRLEQQLNPFSAQLRPIVSHNSDSHLEQNLNDNGSFLFEFCKNLIETYLAVLIQMALRRSKREHITNALSTFRITYEDNQFAIESSRFKPISAGCAHCACVVDGVAYFWGSNGVPCNYSVNKSSDPPEPPHSVKSLDLLAQLNLEVHAVKCGRQHTLVLTNNGLYSFGNNNFSQLGIGRQMQMTLQPMLVKAFDGKNITLLEAGQYHNAAIADHILYTWGWGIYGQLGHGDTENEAIPKAVAFFKFKKVLQVSLGHAHSLVLCQGSSSHTTDLFVFGSNHFGQLGLGGSPASGVSSSTHGEIMDCVNQVKSLVPLRLEISSSRIRLIHTKFFANLAVDDNQRMFTWGSSPQALRLANQIKRRANAKQKVEEYQRREMSKRFEATMSNAAKSTNDDDTSSAHTENTEPNAVDTLLDDGVQDADKSTEITSASVKSFQPEQPITNDQVEQEIEVEDKDNITHATNANHKTEGEDNEKDKPDTIVNIEDAPLSITPITEQIVRTPSSFTIQVIDDVSEENVNKPPQPSRALPLNSNDAHVNAEYMDKKRIDMQQKQTGSEADVCDHMSPHLVDTSEVAGQILQISSGLFHFALISSTCTLYTWGKNLEHQLGTGDKERRAINKPSPIDSIERPMYVDCGADFTLVMTTEYVVKAFGGNSNGQCGRDLGANIDKLKQRVVLPTTKRLMRFESQCVEIPVEINLPRPRIRLDTEPVRYLKSMPRYQADFVLQTGIDFDDINFERHSASQQQYKSTTQAEESSGENVITGPDSDDLISSLENFSNNEASSLNNSLNASPLPLASTGKANLSSGDLTPEEQSYVRLPTTEQADQSVVVAQQKQIVVIADNASTVTSNTNATTTEAQLVEEDEDPELQELRHYIHYCLYVFHGLYNPEKVHDFCRDRLEYRIRMQMLNFKFIEAFTLCLQDCETAHKALKVFEYFTKDTGFVPMRRHDLRFLIYQLLLHFLERKFDMLECEHFFLADLEFYLLELAYVLYFNNNNTVLEQELNQKFKSLVAQESDQSLHQDANRNDQRQQQPHKLEDTDSIFDSLSVKFKTIVCQRLMKYCNT